MYMSLLCISCSDLLRHVSPVYRLQASGSSTWIHTLSPFSAATPPSGSGISRAHGCALMFLRKLLTAGSRLESGLAVPFVTLFTRPSVNAIASLAWDGGAVPSPLESKKPVIIFIFGGSPPMSRNQTSKMDGGRRGLQLSASTLDGAAGTPCVVQPPPLLEAM